MLKQKILEITVVAISLISIIFAIASCIYDDNTVGLRIVSVICIIIAIIFNFYANFNKKKL